MLRVDQANGFAIPWMSTGWKDVNASKTVTSGTFTAIYQTRAELIYSTELIFRVAFATDGSTTGEVQVRHETTDVLGSTLLLDAGLSTTFKYFRVAHGLTKNTGPHNFYIYVRRASGAGNVTVYEPFPAHHGAFMSTVAGGWV
jgi:hypothetical protein